LNPKIQKIIKEIERTKAKIAELQALLPELEKQRTDLENLEVIKAYRAANVKPEDFTAFIEAYQASLLVKPEPAPARSPLPNYTNTLKEDSENE
jgi:DNA repair exonuclease SbcCD ATPase subunit